MRCRGSRPGGDSETPAAGSVAALNVSLAISLVVLELSAAAWVAWLHRSPVLPNTQPGSVDLLQSLPRKFPAREAGTAGEPLRILVLG